MLSQCSGVVVAVVVDTNDPTSHYRVKIKISSQPPSSAEWARVVAAPMGRRFAPIRPNINDKVLVAFEQGDVSRPFVIGVLWDQDDAPPPDAGDPGVIRVPTGSVLKGIDEPCGVEAVRNVFQPLSVYLAAMECQIKVLALLKPLIQIVTQLPSPSADALAQFTASAVALEPCLLTITPASTLPFVRDLLCITLQSLQCLLDEPVSQSEKAAAIDSIQRVLDAAEPYLNAAGIAPVILSTTGSVAGLMQDIASLRIATDAVGGCGR